MLANFECVALDGFRILFRAFRRDFTGWPSHFLLGALCRITQSFEFLSSARIQVNPSSTDEASWAGWSR